MLHERMFSIDVENKTGGSRIEIFPITTLSTTNSTVTSLRNEPDTTRWKSSD